MRLAHRTVGADEAHGNPAVLAGDVEDDLVAVEPHRAAGLAPHRASVHLARNLPLALAEHMIDRSSDGGEPARDLALRRRRRESLGKLFGDEAGGELSFAPARMVHERREERDIVADAVD